MNAATVPAAAMLIPAAHAIERRVVPRLQPALGTICRIGAISVSDHELVGLVLNISETGVSMLVGNPPKAGSEVPGELTADAGDTWLAVTLRVVHVRKILTGDYILGAQFERRLAPDDVRRFLAPPPAAHREVTAESGPSQALRQVG